jgi:hypothetical protein
MGYRPDNTPHRIGGVDIICAWIVAAVALLLLAVSDLAIDREVQVSLTENAAGAVLMDPARDRPAGP